MAGGLVKYRHLSRNSAHRQALLRNLVTSLVRNESIQTTWHKAKEAQRLADKLITLAKRDNISARRRAQGILYTPDKLMPKLFGELRERFLARPGGYTRVLRTQPKSTYDQGASALLEFVDGPKDTRFLMTAATVARNLKEGQPLNKLTKLNRKKTTQFRADGRAVFDELVMHLEEKGGLMAYKDKLEKNATEVQTAAKDEGEWEDVADEKVTQASEAKYKRAMDALQKGNKKTPDDEALIKEVADEMRSLKLGGKNQSR